MKLLILDEPTASLNEKDSHALLDLLLEFKRQGMTAILISHKLNEVKKVADRVTVIRDGRTIETMEPRGRHRGPHHHLMVGRTMENRYPARTPNIGETIFEVRNWVVHHPLHPDRQVIKGINLRCARARWSALPG